MLSEKVSDVANSRSFILHRHPAEMGYMYMF